MSRRSIFAVVLTCASAGVFIVTHVVSARAAAIVRQPALDGIPMVLHDWRGQTAPPLDAETLRQISPDRYLHRYYVSDAGIVEMDVAYYTQRRVGASMHSPLNCLPGNGWTVSDSRELRLDTPQGPVAIRELTVRRNAVRFAMAYWYQSQSRVLTGEIETRLQLLSDSLLQRPADVGLVRVMTQLRTADGSERTVVPAFSSALVPELQRSWK
jgi:EpsI family protein